MQELGIISENVLFVISKNSGVFFIQWSNKIIDWIEDGDCEYWVSSSYNLNQNKSKLVTKLSKNQILVLDLKSRKKEIIYKINFPYDNYLGMQESNYHQSRINVKNLENSLDSNQESDDFLYKIDISVDSIDIEQKKGFLDDLDSEDHFERKNRGFKDDCGEIKGYEDDESNFDESEGIDHSGDDYNGNNREDGVLKPKELRYEILQILFIEFSRFFVVCKDRVLFLYIGDKNLKEVYLDNYHELPEDHKVT